LLTALVDQGCCCSAIWLLQPLLYKVLPLGCSVHGHGDERCQASYCSAAPTDAPAVWLWLTGQHFNMTDAYHSTALTAEMAMIIQS